MLVETDFYNNKKYSFFGCFLVSIYFLGINRSFGLLEPAVELVCSVSLVAFTFPR